MVLVNTIQPGGALPEETKNGLMSAYGQQAAEMQGRAKETTFGVQTLVNIVPRNPFFAMAGKESNNGNPDMLAGIFFALMAGVGLTLINPERAQPLVRGVYCEVGGVRAEGVMMIGMFAAEHSCSVCKGFWRSKSQPLSQICYGLAVALSGVRSQRKPRSNRG